MELAEEHVKAGEDENWAASLIERGRAPVKREYLVSAQVRSTIGNVEAVSESKEAPKVSSEKKSKRQLKKERNEAKKTAENICNVVAETGNPNACTFGASCRYNHDLESYLAQKPADLPGDCPSLTLKRPCRYGVRCRFAGTHVKNEAAKENESTAKLQDDIEGHGGEVNVLKKDFQKLLWKNQVQFPKADGQLKALGLMNKLKERHTPKNAAGNNETEAEDATAKNDAEVVEAKPEEAGGPPSKRIKLDSDASPEDESKVTNGAVEGESKQTEEKTQECYLETKLNSREKKKIDFTGKLYLAPLTTVGNLPFRRLCKKLGADVTCGEMAMCTNLLQGQASEWALLRRHRDEDSFGVQICGSHPDSLSRTAELIERECNVDFIDINIGCPIDLVVNKGAGSCLLTKPSRLEQIVKATAGVLDKPLTLKMRTGYFEGRNCAHNFVPQLGQWGVSAVTIHGRTRQQRYSKLADWKYIYDCRKQVPDDLQVLGNGDIFSYVDWNDHVTSDTGLSSCMIARGALVKPWLFTEIKEQRHWDISSSERLDMLRDYSNFGLEHWGSDSKGVETTRRFLLEWLSYLNRYIPVGLLEVVPQKLNWRPPCYFGRNDLETLMASESAADWVRISEMLLGPAPAGFVFTPKHKSNAYDKAENG